MSIFESCLSLQNLLFTILWFYRLSDLPYFETDSQGSVCHRCQCTFPMHSISSNKTFVFIWKLFVPSELTVYNFVSLQALWSAVFWYWLQGSVCHIRHVYISMLSISSNKMFVYVWKVFVPSEPTVYNFVILQAL